MRKGPAFRRSPTDAKLNWKTLRKSHSTPLLTGRVWVQTPPRPHPFCQRA